MPLLDRDCAELIFALYEYADSPKIDWLYQDTGDFDGFPWAARLNEDDAALDCVFCGTEDTLEAFRDLDAVPVLSPYLAYVHQGFFENIGKVILQLVKMNPKRVRVMGHSYGAAHGRLVARLLTATKIIPCEAPVLFGEPASGFDDSPGRSYRNVGDPIPYLPPPLPGMPWTQGSPLIPVLCVPERADLDMDFENCSYGIPWGPLAPHRIQYYTQALANIDTATP